ncbi:sarcosine/dimethylglycine N-methyltransferase [Halospina denitrificans]|uniref:Sarcosine/dimethylglycine N-methyltransferase n=1 Tax=Halospina denitrificans TaxID=332522 RepID=A0A4R7JRK8_9GAMM|nr:class I SAM-dependent methyltransferase [Halospina denitrificans]TDT40376.1 sarcosine/dimethylglycine N-methyltransferase [Halospina denitrificans]
MTEKYDSEVVNTARDYYNSSDADNFYYHVWGGEDLHVGLYESDDEPILDASRRIVAHIGDLIGGDKAGQTFLDLGSGYGGTDRYMHQTLGLKVTGLNLSEVENERNRQFNRDLGLEDKIDVYDGNFEELPFEHDSFDIVFSQDSFLHSGNREKIIEEVARVLKPGGLFIFTDPMMADDCPEGVLKPILDRLHLDTLGSPAFYRDACKRNGMSEIGFEDHSPQLPRHYGRVLEETQRREQELVERDLVSQAYIDRMKTGLQNWVNGGNNGYLTWGIFRFQKD